MMASSNSIGRMEQADPTHFGKLEIIPVAQSFRFTWPLGWGGFVYNRPHSVIVRRDGQVERRLVITDQTRRLQLFVAAYTLCSILLLWLLSGQRS